MNFLNDLRTNWKYILIVVVILTAVVGGGVLWSSTRQEVHLTEFPGGSDRFRNLTIQFVRAVAENYFDGQPTQYPEELEIRGNWELYITIYHQGKIKGDYLKVKSNIPGSGIFLIEWVDGKQRFVQKRYSREFLR